MKRRRFLAAAAGLVAAPFPFLKTSDTALASDIDPEEILNDPEAPQAGNPKGDVTLVNFTDYNCPYCKKATPDLHRAVREDGGVRLVYKDWPILSEASVYGAQMALAARYQGQYQRVHMALMSIPGRRIAKERMLAAVEASGVDMPRLRADAAARSAEILALLRRNMTQADSLGLQGTPTYLIGPFRTSTLDYAGFKKALAEARRRQQAAK